MSLKKEIVPALKVYLFTWLFFLAFYTIVVWRSAASFIKGIEGLGSILSHRTVLIGIHTSFLIFYLLFLLFRYIYRGKKRFGWKVAFKRLAFFLLLPVLGGYISFKGVVAANSYESFDYLWNYAVENPNENSNDLYSKDGKHRGMSVFWSHGNAEDLKAATDVLVKDNIEWSAVIPFMDQESETHPELRSSYTSTSKRRDSVMISRMRQLRSRNIRVHLKPHVWMVDGWRSNITLSDADWKIWFDTYRKSMVHYAKIAEAENAELFCIGTELRTAIQKMPDEWLRLIQEVKEVYKGKLTYAANWDDPIEKIPFWDAMDYIGIQAYFPLTENENPELADIKNGWQRHIKMLEQASSKYKKPILFTEVGYRSDASATVKPWEWGSSLAILYNKKSDRTQQLAFEALFDELWDESWFAGCYIWQWHTRTSQENAAKNVDFTPRFKPAENTIAKWYGTEGEAVKIYDD